MQRQLRAEAKQILKPLHARYRHARFQRDSAQKKLEKASAMLLTAHHKRNVLLGRIEQFLDTHCSGSKEVDTAPVLDRGRVQQHRELFCSDLDSLVLLQSRVRELIAQREELTMALCRCAGEECEAK